MNFRLKKKGPLYVVSTYIVTRQILAVNEMLLKFHTLYVEQYTKATFLR